MPEQKKRGFHALEERIHQIEEEDAKASREAAPQTTETAARTAAGERPAERERERR